MSEINQRNWKKVTIGEIAEVFDGPHATPKKTKKGPYYLGISTLNKGRLLLNDADHISEEDYHKWTKRITPIAGDIVFSYETRLGEVALIPDGIRCALGRRMGLLRPKNNRVYSRFLLYAYQSPEFQDVLNKNTLIGSTVNRISIGEMPFFKITLPPLAEQKAISSILGSLDDKIELNNQMNQTLETMARALYKSWFVDFDPVVAKAAGRKPYGMDEETAALFPDRFVDSELGPIPEGWEVKSITEVADFINGRNFTKNASGSGKMVIRIAELNRGSSGSTVYNDVDADDKNIAYPGDILFAWSGSLDVYRWRGDEALINQHIFKIIPKGFPDWLAHQAIEDSIDFFRTIAEGKATTMGHIKRGHLNEAFIVVPNSKIISTADKKITPLYDQWLINHQESKKLTQLRDILLPKLISGEIRIKDAEKVVSEVV